ERRPTRTRAGAGGRDGRRARRARAGPARGHRHAGGPGRAARHRGAPPRRAPGPPRPPAVVQRRPDHRGPAPRNHRPAAGRGRPPDRVPGGPGDADDPGLAAPLPGHPVRRAVQPAAAGPGDPAAGARPRADHRAPVDRGAGADRCRRAGDRRAGQHGRRRPDPAGGRPGGRRHRPRVPVAAVAGGAGAAGARGGRRRRRHRLLDPALRRPAGGDGRLPGGQRGLRPRGGPARPVRGGLPAGGRPLDRDAVGHPGRGAAHPGGGLPRLRRAAAAPDRRRPAAYGRAADPGVRLPVDRQPAPLSRAAAGVAGGAARAGRLPHRVQPGLRARDERGGAVRGGPGRAAGPGRAGRHPPDPGRDQRGRRRPVDPGRDHRRRVRRLPYPGHGPAAAGDGHPAAAGLRPRHREQVHPLPRDLRGGDGRDEPQPAAVGAGVQPVPVADPHRRAPPRADRAPAAARGAGDRRPGPPVVAVRAGRAAGPGL
ncbi:MAG: hypothetical protein AVDCRST_MAG41-2910, partial [uncultured Corynebacteriales bacterium]